MKTKLFLLSLLFILPSCFLTQSKPSAAFPASFGIVRMYELSGDRTEAAVVAGFFTESARASYASALGNFTQVNPDPISYAEPQCTFEQENVSKRAGGIQALDAGKITFTSALHSTPVALNLSPETLIYSVPLESDVQAGMYEFIGEGSKMVPAFHDTVSMPEALKDVSLSGFDLASGVYQVRRLDGMEVAWKAPITLHEASVIEVAVITQVGNTVSSLNCKVLERNLANGEATYRWALPASQLTRLPSSSLSRAMVTRFHVFRSSSRNPQFNLEGRRVVSNMGEVL